MKRTVAEAENGLPRSAAMTSEGRTALEGESTSAWTLSGRGPSSGLQPPEKLTPTLTSARSESYDQPVLSGGAKPGSVRAMPTQGGDGHPESSSSAARAGTRERIGAESTPPSVPTDGLGPYRLRRRTVLPVRSPPRAYGCPALEALG
jgi:hypothetical protein